MAIPMLKVWGRVTSINVQKVLWVLDALGLAYTREDAGLEHSVNRSASFLAKNPNGRVPLLEDDDYQIWESHSICRYLCSRLHLPASAVQVAEELYPADPQQRGQVDQWLDWTLWGVSGPMVTVFRQRVRLAPEKREPARIHEAEQESLEHFAIASQHLERSTFLAGDQLSLADIALAPIAYRGACLGVFDSRLTGLTRWLERLSQDDNYKRWVAVPLR